MATLRELREKAFLSQVDLAEKSGITIASLSSLENGHRKPQWKTIRKLAKALDVPPGDIDFK